MVTVLFWSLRRRSWRVKGTLAALGLLLPVAFAAVMPIRLEVWLDGIFFGALMRDGNLVDLRVLEYASAASAAGRSRRASSGSARSLSAAGTGLLIAALILSVPSSQAAEEQTPNRKRCGRSSSPARGRVDPVVIPYDPDHDALSADRVLLEQRAFLELWNRAHPERPLGTHPAQEACVTETLYTARPVPSRSGKFKISRAIGSGPRGRFRTLGPLLSRRSRRERAFALS